MKNRLVKDWQRIALRAWSMQLLYAQIILAAAVAGLPVINEAWGVDPVTYALLALGLLAAALR